MSSRGASHSIYQQRALELPAIIVLSLEPECLSPNKGLYKGRNRGSQRFLLRTQESTKARLRGQKQARVKKGQLLSSQVRERQSTGQKCIYQGVNNLLQFQLWLRHEHWSTTRRREQPLGGSNSACARASAKMSRGGVINPQNLIRKR